MMTDDGQTLKQRVVFVVKACNLQFCRMLFKPAQSHEGSGMRYEESRYESLTIIRCCGFEELRHLCFECCVSG